VRTVCVVPWATGQSLSNSQWYTAAAPQQSVVDAGTVSTGLLEGQQITVKFQSGYPANDSVAATASAGAAKKMYRVFNADSGEALALKTPGQRQDVLDHVIAAQYAKDFGRGVRFVVPVLARVDAAFDENEERVKEWEQLEVLLEPLLESTYDTFLCRRHKYGGGTFVYRDLLQAFFHYMYESSGRLLVVWDLQGVREDGGAFLLTDPYIIHDGHTIWRYGCHHNTYRILHPSCNAFCPCLHSMRSQAGLGNVTCTAAAGDDKAKEGGVNNVSTSTKSNRQHHWTTQYFDMSAADVDEVEEEFFPQDRLAMAVHDTRLAIGSS